MYLSEPQKNSRKTSPGCTESFCPRSPQEHMQFFFHLHVTLNLRCPSQTVIVSQSNCKLNNYTVLRKTIRKEQFIFSL